MMFLILDLVYSRFGRHTVYFSDIRVCWFLVIETFVIDY